MSEFLSQTMWAALFQTAETMRTNAGGRTVEALRRRGLIERAEGGGWRPTPHGRKMIDWVLSFDVSPSTDDVNRA